MRVSQKFLTYMVVGTLVMALSIGCKSNEEAEGVNIGQYAGTYASDEKLYGANSNQYFVLQVKSDTIDYGVSDSQSMSTVTGTFSIFTKTGEGIYASRSGQSLVDVVLNFSGNSLTCIPSSVLLDNIFTEEQNNKSFNMTKVN